MYNAGGSPKPKPPVTDIPGRRSTQPTKSADTPNSIESELGRIMWAIFHPRRNNFRYDVALACLEEVSCELHRANQKIKELEKLLLAKQANGVYSQSNE